MSQCVLKPQSLLLRFVRCKVVLDRKMGGGAKFIRQECRVHQFADVVQQAAQIGLLRVRKCDLLRKLPADQCGAEGVLQKRGRRQRQEGLAGAMRIMKDVQSMSRRHAAPPVK